MRTKNGPRSEGWFVLSEVVEERELARLTRGLRDVSRPVLDFSQTVHIRWKDAAAFARRLLRERPGATVRVVGLDEYCAQILLFAWSLEAWEMFELVSEEAACGLGEDRPSPGDSAPGFRSWVPDPIWMPGLN
jgi:hypothetical protein